MAKRFTAEQERILNEWARTAPELRRAFPYTTASNTQTKGFGFLLNKEVDGGEHFYIRVQQSDGQQRLDTTSILTFNTNDFYLSSTTSPTEKVVNFRGTASGGTSGVTDHGALTGLLDNDHPQYARKAADWNTFRQGITAEAFYLESGTNVYQGPTYTEFESAQAVSFNNGIHMHEQATAPGTPAADGAVLWAQDNNGHSTFWFKDNDAVAYQILQDQYLIVRNTTGVLITKGQAVYVNGTTGGTPTVALAKSDSSTTLPCLGLANQDIAINAFGHIMVQGVISSINTSALTAGARVWVSSTTAGGLTTTRPSYPAFQQAMGVVLSSGIGNGSLFIIGSVDDLTHIEAVSDGIETIQDPLKLTFKSGDFYLTKDSLGQPLVNLTDTFTAKHFTLQYPSKKDTVTWFVAERDYTVQDMTAFLRQLDSGFYPFVDFTIRHRAGIPVRGTGTELTTGGWRIGFYPGGSPTATENPLRRSSFNSNAISNNEFVWVETKNVGEGNGVEQELHISVRLV